MDLHLAAFFPFIFTLLIASVGSAHAATDTSCQPGPECPTTPAETDAEEPDQPDVDAKTRTVNLRIQGEDADLNRLEYGGGWNGADGLYGRFAYRRLNLFGRGGELGLGLEIGDGRELYELELRKPWLFGRPQALALRLFGDRLDDRVGADADFEHRRAGGTLTYSRRRGSSGSLRLSYSLTDVDDIESTRDGDGEILTRTASYGSSAVRASWIHDTVDNPFYPTRGLRFSSSLEVAGGALGGDAGHLETRLGLAWFRPLGKAPLRWVLGIRASVGWLAPSDGGELSPQQRFFLGGEGSLRGFRRRSIAARDDAGTLLLDSDGFPVGGERLARFGLEQHILLADRLRLVLFADLGGVFSATRGVGVDGLRTSAGVELRLKLPKLGVPLRLIYANNLEPMPGDRFDEFSVSLGFSF